MAEPKAATPTTPTAGRHEPVRSVTRNELPLHCPTPDMTLWNSHPRVFLPIEEHGEARCPYCGTRYVLKD